MKIVSKLKRAFEILGTMPSNYLTRIVRVTFAEIKSSGNEIMTRDQRFSQDLVFLWDPTFF